MLTVAMRPSSSCSRARPLSTPGLLHSLAGSSVTLTLTSLVATTSTDTWWAAMTANTWARKPCWPSMRVDTMSSMLTFCLRTTDVNRLLLISRCRVISVPGAAML